MQLMRDALAHCDLHDLGFFGSSYTWQGGGVKCRLDRVAASASWVDLFPAVRVSHLDPIHGDHIPIFLSCGGALPLRTRSRRFRLESFWVQHADCHQVVEQGWATPVGGTAMFQVQQKIMHSHFALNHWQRATFGNRWREMDMIRSRLQHLLSGSHSDSVQLEQVELSSKLDHLLSAEHKFWKQRSKSTEACMEEIVLGYFSTMFTSDDVDRSQMDEAINLLQPKVSREMNDDLCAPYSAEEIKAALFQMYPTKAPGPDGMPPLFFQQYWEVVGPDVVAAVQGFLHSGRLLGSLNYTHICLIPKVPNPEHMSDLRPIALCNVIYKICSKAVANRLKRILDILISPVQSAFIPGRLITDNTLIANEISHYINNWKSSTEGIMSLKLDMSKAYDRMEWCFLEAVLLWLGFAERGLRQGDPLSPYLFLLCAEVFSMLLERKAALGLLQGIQICPEAPTIHHLLFADDSLLFGRATQEEFTHIQSVFSTYELASGQKVNYAKSSVVFSKKVCGGLQSLLSDSLGVKIVLKHEEYLGLPTYLGRNKTEPFAFIKERLSKKLVGWQGKILSGAGKDLLIRVVAQSLPTYTMNCFMLPQHFCDSLHQLCARFWWGSKAENRKIHWLSWAKLCQPKEVGGMGFRDLHAHNTALLAKQEWRFLCNPTSLVARLYGAKYFLQGDIWNCVLTSPPSACWRSIYSALSLLRSGIRWQVGNGATIHAWDDLWIPRPVTFRPVIHMEGGPLWVKDYLLSGLCWNVDLVREWFNQCDAELILAILLSRWDVPDRLVWHYDAKGNFTMKSAYLLAFDLLHGGSSSSEGGGTSEFWKSIWFANVPGKIKVHFWKVCSSILPTNSQLCSRRVPILDGCFFCNAEETIMHVSCECPFVKDLLNYFPSLGIVQTLHMVHGSVRDWLALCLGHLTKPNASLFLILIWFVWKERNKRLWNGRFASLDQLAFQVTSFYHLHMSVQAPSRQVVGRRNSQWTPPSPGWLKANCVGIYDASSLSGGIGVVLRDSSGSIVGGVCSKVRWVSSLQTVEALACRAACNLVDRFGLAPVAFESACQHAVTTINSQGVNTSLLGRVYDDISTILGSLHGSYFSYISRTANKVATMLARYALGSNFDLYWSGSVPTEISGFIATLCTN
ncbi:uncharacterized protein LOC133725376 [Rosa rugosa]|uniref:uncharacterized protein LOC133725376 n=1 Tax=Rosa rugosa TaxID=74645 RepID=UPI002B41709D|nr:uncharacterized protein LOC133725376 [Rosa rugosa]